jgi:hypothetical protein
MKRIVAAATVVLVLLSVANWLDPVREGLNGTHYANATFTDPPAASSVDPQPSNDRLASAWNGRLPAQFSTTWAGSILAMHDGPYALATISDDGSWVYVDGQLVVDNRGHRVWPRGATGAVTLSRGVHAIYVRFAQDGGEGGPSHFELLWARAGQPLERIPVWALTPRRVSFWAFALSAGLKQALAAAEWAWVGALVLWALTWAWSWIPKGQAWLEREQVWPAFRWILAGSLVLNAIGIWWGLPGGSWAADELSPVLVLGAAARWFGHGWFDRYPPFHYYVLTAAFSPMLLLERWGRLELTSEMPYASLVLISRLVSLAAGIGTLLATYACGARTFGKGAGVWAAAMFALVTPFVYYAKTANLDVPYLFWFAISLVFYLRALDRLKLGDIVGFAACGMAAIGTKDQAYGLYLLTPFAIVWRIWRVNREAGVPRPLLRAIFDRRLQWAAAVAIGVFALVHNLFFNLHGFVEHVRYITGGGSETYRDFEPTVAGRTALLWLSMKIVQVAWGWPMFVVSVAGVGIALLTPQDRRIALWLALPVVSYYLGFVNVVLYNYDRFMLPVCLILSLFGGMAVDTWLATVGRSKTWRLALAAGIFAYAMLCAATVDLVMLRDSRYAVEEWLRANVRPGHLVGFVFPEQYYPRLNRFNAAQIVSVSELIQREPAYFVLNADYALAEPPGSEIGQLIAGLENGQLDYKIVFRFRQPGPWSWLPGQSQELIGDRKQRPITSVLRHINPRYEVFTKNR